MEENNNQSPTESTTVSTVNTNPPSNSKIYPEFVVLNNQHPNRLLAFPFLGYSAKLIALIPVFIFAILIGIWWFITILIVPFVILFTGKYWDPAYKATLSYARYLTKINLFLN